MPRKEYLRILSTMIYFFSFFLIFNGQYFYLRVWLTWYKFTITNEYFWIGIVSSFFCFMECFCTISLQSSLRTNIAYPFLNNCDQYIGVFVQPSVMYVFPYLWIKINIRGPLYENNSYFLQYMLLVWKWLFNTWLYINYRCSVLVKTQKGIEQDTKYHNSSYCKGQYCFIYGFDWHDIFVL